MTLEYHRFCLFLSFREETVDEVAELMKAHGWYPQEFITLYKGQILDGRHRYLAAQKADVEPQFVNFEGTEGAAFAFVYGANVNSREFNIAEKKEYFDRARDEGFWTQQKEGRPRSAKTVTDDTVSDGEIAKLLGVSRRTLKRWDAERENESETPKSSPKRLLNTGNDEWYTPEKYINLVRDVMGDIDLDPASCEFAQKIILANKFFTKEDDGLDQPWKGRIWLNPPYSHGLMDKFTAKICDEYQFGGVTEAIIMTHNSADTIWFDKLVEVSACVCLTRGRISCYSEREDKNAPVNGQAFFYMGQNSDRFEEVFELIGNVMIRRKNRHG